MEGRAAAQGGHDSDDAQANHSGVSCKPAFRAVHNLTNADEYGGMPLLGVNGVTIIAHGGSSPLAIKNALRNACATVGHQLNPRIIEEVQRHHETTRSAHAHPTA